MSRISRDPYNIVICGVGGQGNILISKVIGNAVLRKGYCVTVVDDIGASQRAGMVTSKIRISPGKSCGPLIPEGQAHLVLGLEPLETLRMLYRYGNPDVLTLTNIAPIFPAEVLSRRVQYPDMDKLKKSISSLSQRVWFVNATRTALDLGAVIVTNVVLLGALIALNEIPLTRNDTESELRTYLPAQKLNINLEALRLGYEMPGVQNMTNNPRMR